MVSAVAQNSPRPRVRNVLPRTAAEICSPREAPVSYGGDIFRRLCPLQAGSGNRLLNEPARARSGTRLWTRHYFSCFCLFVSPSVLVRCGKLLLRFCRSATCFPAVAREEHL